jgi:hypothetical protein
VELAGRATRYFAHPHVQILTLTRLEEQHIVAIIQLGEGIELVELALRIKLGVFTAVREHRGEVVEQVAVPTLCQ